MHVYRRMRKTKKNGLLSSKRRVTRRVTRTRKRKEPNKQRRKTMIYRRQTKRYRRKKYRTKKSQRGGAEESPVGTTGDGTSENPYRVIIERTLHNDSTTVVYKCKHGGVVKALKVDKTKNERAIQKEVILHMACLPHPNILVCYGYGYGAYSGLAEKGILLEKCLIDLDSLVRKTTTIEKQKVINNFHTQMKSVSYALKHIHSKDIIHRDIKPSNIIACFPPNTGDLNYCTFKLFDFGEAHDRVTLSSISDLSNLKNTPCYSGPLEPVAGEDMDNRKTEDKFKLLLTWVDVLAISSRTNKHTTVFPFGCFGNFVEGGAGDKIKVSSWEKMMGQDSETVYTPEAVVFMHTFSELNANVFGEMSLENKRKVMSEYVKLKPHNEPDVQVQHELTEFSNKVTEEVDKAMQQISGVDTPDTPDTPYIPDTPDTPDSS